VCFIPRLFFFSTVIKAGFFQEGIGVAMKVHSITLADLDRFVSLSDHPGGESDKEFILDMWAMELSQPEFFFILEKEYVPVGRVSYWRLKARPEELRMIYFKLPWEGDYLSTGLQLLLESWERLSRSGGRHVVRRLASSWDYLEEQIEVLDHTGMSLFQEKKVFLLSLGDVIEDNQYRLVYRSLADMGEMEYVDAIRKVTAGTPDREIQEMGGEQAASQLFSILKEDTLFEPGWLQLAYEPEGELAGLVAPVRMLDNANEGAIGLIGLIPEKRGLGYSDDLLRRGRTILRAVGVTDIYAETDSDNTAMRRTLERAVYQEIETVWLYRGKVGNLS
jgi:RimJ/RimL family protein N-acetyltransferase